MTGCVRPWAAVWWSPRTKRAGASTPTCSGSGHLSRPRQPSMRFSAAGACGDGARHWRGLSRRAPVRRLAVVSAIYAGRAPDLSRAPAAALSRAAARLPRPAFRVTAVKAILQAALATRDRYHAAGGLRSRLGGGARALCRAARAAPAAKRRVAAWPSGASNNTSSSNSTPSSAFSLTRPSMRPIGSPNTPCGQQSSPQNVRRRQSRPPRR